MRVIHGASLHFKSDGALTVLSQVPHGAGRAILFFVPKPLRDAVYNPVARNRYRICGNFDGASCQMRHAREGGGIASAPTTSLDR